jgi:hypothetical protein
LSPQPPKLFANETLYQLSYTPMNKPTESHSKNAPQGKLGKRPCWRIKRAVVAALRSALPSSASRQRMDEGGAIAKRAELGGSDRKACTCSQRRERRLATEASHCGQRFSPLCAAAAFAVGNVQYVAFSPKEITMLDQLHPMWTKSFANWLEIRIGTQTPLAA